MSLLRIIALCLLFVSSTQAGGELRPKILDNDKTIREQTARLQILPKIRQLLLSADSVRIQGVGKEPLIVDFGKDLKVNLGEIPKKDKYIKDPKFFKELVDMFSGFTMEEGGMCQCVGQLYLHYYSGNKHVLTIRVKHDDNVEYIGEGVTGYYGAKPGFQKCYGDLVRKYAKEQ